jgi:hypothetical protein
MVQVRYKKVKGYSGPLIYGKAIPPSPTKNHLERAVQLTEGVETGFRVGSIMAADGTAMTAGKGQHILVYPKELANEDFNALDDQGGLGELLHFIEVTAPSGELDLLYGEFVAEGWYVASDGKLRWHDDARVKVKGRWLDCKAGDVVHGAVLRDTITPVGGKVPKTGEQWETAKKWAILFHNVFAQESSFDPQATFETHHLVYRVATRKFSFRPGYRKETILQVVYGGPTDLLKLKAGRDISDELDLAMCVFHSHTVNAPAIAFRRLRETIQATGYDAARHRGTAGEITFARELLKRLAKAKYGRWNESVDGGRWARTRAHARTSGQWPTKFFRGQNPVMPAKF